MIKNITTMKMLVNSIFSIVLVFFCLMSSAQSDKSHSIKLQLNPYLDKDLFNGNSIKYVYALRYTFSIKDHITLGPELSGYNVKLLYLDPNYTFSNFNIGGFFRYSFFPSSRVRPFFEFSPYYTFFSYKNLPENTYEGVPPNGKDSYLSGYLAPGISVFNKSKKFSLDLFCKFSGKAFVNGNKLVLQPVPQSMYRDIV
jgi:hypothetical protein